MGRGKRMFNVFFSGGSPKQWRKRGAGSRAVCTWRCVGCARYSVGRPLPAPWRVLRCRRGARREAGRDRAGERCSGNQGRTIWVPKPRAAGRGAG